MKRNPSKNRGEWQQIITDYQQSGQSVESYCATKNISQASLNKWRYLFKHEAQQTEPSIPKNFVRIKAHTPTSLQKNETINCHLPNGVRIEWPASLNASKVLPLLRGLA